MGVLLANVGPVVPVDDPTPPFMQLPPPTTVQAYDLLSRLDELSGDCPRDVRQEIRDSIEPSLRHHIQSVSSKAALRELTTALSATLGRITRKLDTLIEAQETTEVAAAVQQVGGTVIGTVPSIVPVFGGRALTWNHVLLTLLATVAASAMGVDVVAVWELATGVPVPTLDQAEP
mgnify:FL=1